MSERRVNVGDVTSPRWAGGVTNPDSRDAEVEALRAENAAYLKGFNGSEMLRRAVEAERDALRAQLDSMTVETRRSRIPADAPPMILKIVDERRLVSPWTAVEEGI